MPARITSINLSWKDNYVSYNDSDIQTDYFNGYSLGINSTLKWVKEDGAPKITVTVTNDDPKIPALKRIQQIAKACGYTVEDKSHEHTYHGYMDQEVKSFVYEWLLTADAERMKMLDAEDAEEQRKQKEAEAYAKTPAARMARLKAEINSVKNVTAVIGAQGFHVINSQERAKQIAELEKELAKVELEAMFPEVIA